MKRLHYLFLLLLVSPSCFSQTLLTGKVVDERNIPIPGANIIIEGTYEGTSSDSNGDFQLTTNLSGAQTIVVQCIGFEPHRFQTIFGAETIFVQAILKEEISKIDEVVISAGAFEASDKKKSVVLKPLDIVTTPSSNADIYGTIGNLPGATTAHDGKLIVRGGEKNETLTFIDGLQVAEPYTSSVNDLPTRGRFMPFSFDGMMFSSGAYSCEYGNALSAIVDMKTIDESSENKFQIMLMNVGMSINSNKSWGKSSLTAAGNYSNMGPYYSIVEGKNKWTRNPVSSNGMLQYRSKIKKHGLLKAYLYTSFDANALLWNDFNSNTDYEISMNNTNYYGNVNYTQQISEKSKLFAGSSFGYDGNAIEIKDIQHKKQQKNDFHTKISFKHIFSSKFSLNTGIENFYTKTDNNIHTLQLAPELHETNRTRNALFSEARIRFSNSFFSQSGIRLEIDAQGESVVLPRTSFAYKLSDYSQTSVAYGYFSQENYIESNHTSSMYSKAHHIVWNYQYERAKRFLRLEIFDKEYTDLPLIESENNITETTSNGFGYARGIDVFWRDEKTIEGLDYWMSYSLIHSERKFNDFPKQAQPSFIPKHSFSFVAKQYVGKLSSFYGISYNYRSGYSYNNPNSSQFMSGRTPSFHDVAITYTYLFDLFGKDALIYLSANNLLFQKDVYGYEFKATENEGGIYENRPLWNSNIPFVILVFGITI